MRKLKRQLKINLFFFVMPLVSALLLYNFHGLLMINQQVGNAGRNVMEVYDNILVQDMDVVQEYLTNILLNDLNVASLNYSTEYLDSYLVGESIDSDTTRFLQSGFEGIYAVALYAREQNMIRMYYRDSSSSAGYEVNNAIQKEIYQRIKHGRSYDWEVWQAGEKSFLIRILHNRNVYFAVVVDLEWAVQLMEEISEDQQGYLVYVDSDNQPLTSQEFILENEIELKETEKEYYITGKKGSRYMVVQKEFRYADIRLLYIMPYADSFLALDLTQTLLFLMTIAAVALLPIGFYLMRRAYIVPIETLVQTMRQIKDGDSDKILEEEYTVEEFCEMKRCFNEMLESIRNLKLSEYEQRIQMQDIQLQHLQIQIRPHFFLNCLKNLYALSVSGENEKLQRMILELSEYLRGIIRTSENLVPVEEELRSVETYLKIQEMSLFRPPEYVIDMAPGLESKKIPPMSVLTFVENAVKHGVSETKKLVISIRIWELDDEEESFLCITILDNGHGFPEELLEKLNRQDETLGNGHVGIDNVKKRIQVLYNSRATVFFSNFEGACVEMILPVQEEGENDSTDCG